MSAGETWYEILEISAEASAEEIRLAYFEQARQYHPDTNPGKLAKDFFYKIQEAYETLSDPIKRRQYDESIKSKKIEKAQLESQIIYSRNEIPRLQESQIVYAILKLRNLREIEDKKAPQVHICLVIDCSTSMKGARIEMVKENILRLMTTLRSSDLISIVLFNDSAEILLTPTKASDTLKIKDRLSSIKCFGGTEVYKGLKAGSDLLWGNSSTDIFRHLLLLTDGHTYGDEEACFELAIKMKIKGIGVSTLGIGHEWNDEFMDRLAGLTGGNCTFVSNAGDLREYVMKLGESFAIVVTEGVSLDIQSDQNVTIESIFRLQPDITELPIERTIPLGELYSNKFTTWFLTFKIKPVGQDQESVFLAKGKIRFRAVSSTNKESKLFINMTLPVIEDKLNPDPPREIVEALSGITVYQMQKKANIDVKSGNISNAIRRLGNISTQLLKAGKFNLAKKVLQEVEALKSTQKYSMDGDKQLKYGTRALISTRIEKKNL